MALHDLGYRHWDEEPSRQSYSWFAIARYGVRLAWKSNWLRRLIFIAVYPAIFLAVFIFFYEQLPEQPQLVPMVLAGVPYSEIVAPALEAGVISVSPDAVGDSSGLFDALVVMPKIIEVYVNSQRSQYWSELIYLFFQRGLLNVVLLFGMITPRLISHDVQSRAFLLYFSRPITPFQYVLGKAMTAWVFLVAVTTLPALICYLGGILVSPSLAVIFTTWLIPLRILLATIMVGIPTTMLALWLSSVVRESRYAAFGWFAIWVVGLMAAGILADSEVAAGSRGDDSPLEIIAKSRWAYLSLYHVLGNSLEWVFGMASLESVKWFLLELLLISGVTFKLLMKRVIAPIQI